MKTDAEHQPDLFYRFRFFPGERKVFENKETISLSDYAEKYRIVPNAGAHPGPWRNSLSPHLIFIMDMAEQPWVRELYMQKCAQSGGSEVMYNYEAKAAIHDPGTALFIMPTETEAKKIAEEKLIPTFEGTPPLRAILSDNPDNTAKRRIKTKNGNLIYPAWANSPASLAAFKVDRAYPDEMNKFPTLTGVETSPIKLIRKRTRTKKDTYKIIGASTPTTEEGHISVAMEEVQALYRFHPKCPDCGHEQLMNFDRLQYPEDADAKTIEQEELARYQCEKCESLWTDAKRNEAVRRAVAESENKGWKATKGKHIRRPKRVGFHIPSFIVFDVSLSEIAACFVRSKTDRAELIDFYNDYMAEPFIESEEGEGLTDTALYDKREDYWPQGAEWRVPMAASVLTAFVDVQKNRLELEVKAWGEGQENWGIEHRQLPGDPSKPEVWEKLDEALSKKYLHESGIELKIAIVGIDSGYLAPKIYKFVKSRESKRIYATKGSSQIGKSLFSFSNINLSRSKNKSLKDLQKINLCIIGTEVAKDQLFHWMLIEDYGPGYTHWHKGYSHDYFKQITAEHAVTRKGQRRWVTKVEGSRNEAIDLAVGNYAMIEALNPNFEMLNTEIKALTQKERAPQKQKRPVIVNGRR